MFSPHQTKSHLSIVSKNWLFFSSFLKRSIILTNTCKNVSRPNLFSTNLKRQPKPNLFTNFTNCHYQKASFSFGRPASITFPGALPFVIPIASRSVLFASPFLYRYGFFSRFPRASLLLFASPVIAFLLMIVSNIEFNKYNGRWRLVFLNEQEELQKFKDDYGFFKTTLKLKKGFEKTKDFARISRIFRELLVATGELQTRPVLQQDWELMVLESDEVNAKISPSGLLIINSKTLELANSDHELAFILAHELSHVLFRHSSEIESFSEVLNEIFLFFSSGLMSVSLMFPAFGELFGPALKLSVPSLVVPYSRYQELEADKGGLFLAARAGYNPREFPNFWRRLQTLNSQEHTSSSSESQLATSRLKCNCIFGKVSAEKGDCFPTEKTLLEKIESIVGQTHPTLEERIIFLEEIIPEAFPIYKKTQSYQPAGNVVVSAKSWFLSLFSLINNTHEKRFVPLFQDPSWNSQKSLL